jgi:hypothetical protein
MVGGGGGGGCLEFSGRGGCVDGVRVVDFPAMWLCLVTSVKRFVGADSCGGIVVLVGHHVKCLDVPILYETCVRHGLNFDELGVTHVFDTLEWARSALVCKVYSLSSIYGIATGGERTCLCVC